MVKRLNTPPPTAGLANEKVVLKIHCLGIIFNTEQARVKAKVLHAVGYAVTFTL